MAGNKVLIVDDDPDIVVYLTSYLGDNGYQTRAASDSNRALETLATFHPDAVLVDVLMPGRSGLDLLCTLRRDSRYRDLPLVVVTGMEELLQDDCQSYLGANSTLRGPDAVLGKPIDPDVLLVVLAHLGLCPVASPV